MKLFKRIIYTLLGLLLLSAVVLIGVILYAEYSGRRFNPSDITVMANRSLNDEESRLVYDENGNLAELPEGSVTDSTDASDTQASEADTVETGSVETNSEETASLETDASQASSVQNTGTGDDVEQVYVMDKGSNLFHTADCDYAANITSENRSEMTTTRAKIVNAGYEPCSNCNP